MEKFKETIEAKYWWVQDYQAMFQWIDLALNQGVEENAVIDFIAGHIFARAI